MRSLIALAVGLYPTILGAQVPRPPFYADTAPSALRSDLVFPASRQPHVPRWWEAASLAGFTLAVMTQDEGTTDEIREHPTRAAADLASVFRRAGQPEVYAALPVAIVTTGLLAGNGRIARAGGRLAASVVLSTAAFETLKLSSGRARPDAGEGAWRFSPFSGNSSLPSGHSTVAFALATSLSHELHNPVATVALYTAAAGTAWSRIYDQRHWASDVVFGAALGIASAEVAHGHWRIFGIRPPALILEHGGAGVQLAVPLTTH
jgi:membrane-associated phospholipid phosphatase